MTALASIPVNFCSKFHQVLSIPTQTLFIVNMKRKTRCWMSTLMQKRDLLKVRKMATKMNCAHHRNTRILQLSTRILLLRKKSVNHTEEQAQPGRVVSRKHHKSRGLACREAHKATSKWTPLATSLNSSTLNFAWELGAQSRV